MTKKLSRRGRHFVLPIVGDTLVEARISMKRLPALVFASVDVDESELRIEDRVILRRGEQERVLDGSRPGAAWRPQELSPLLELLGSQVKDAVAEEDGTLRVSFSNELVLEIRPSGPGEAWHFQHPRPSPSVGRRVGRSVSLTGAPGHLI